MLSIQIESSSCCCLQRFACVENAKFGTPAEVKPGGSWEATANFSVIDSFSA